MIKQIGYYTGSSVQEELLAYTDDRLVEVIRLLSEDGAVFNTVELTYWWSDDYHVKLVVLLSDGKNPYVLGNHKVIYLFECNLLEDEETLIQQESHRIKRMLKRRLSDIKVKSRLSLR